MEAVHSNVLPLPISIEKQWDLREQAHLARVWRDMCRQRTMNNNEITIERSPGTPWSHLFLKILQPDSPPCMRVHSLPRLVSRFRRSYPFAARARTNVGTKGTLATI